MAALSSEKDFGVSDLARFLLVYLSALPIGYSELTRFLRRPGRPWLWLRE